MRLLAVGMDPPTRSRCMKRMTKPTVMTARTMEYTAALLARPVTCYENKVLWYLLTVLTYQSHVTSL